MSYSIYCYDNGLKEIYYRVPKESLPVYIELSRKSLFLGQEGVVDLSFFTLDGGDRKSIRNALSKITEQGYTTHINTPPLRDGLIQKLKAVSEEWLKLTERNEIIFSQGMFVEKEIKGQREYKEKFNPQWNDKFLVYTNDYDLLQVPAVLAGVIKP